jgi:hypothetical protein
MDAGDWKSPKAVAGSFSPGSAEPDYGDNPLTGRRIVKAGYYPIIDGETLVRLINVQDPFPRRLGVLVSDPDRFEVRIKRSAESEVLEESVCPEVIPPHKHDRTLPELFEAHLRGDTNMVKLALGA